MQAFKVLLNILDMELLIGATRKEMYKMVRDAHGMDEVDAGMVFMKRGRDCLFLAVYMITE